ncbi:MAG: tRNA lysidine(34) synthetase TilS [Deltaproteobacteria bacterium]|nr:MAG: tRNA lysidine(34) synthetase TilS [Deltaproteobacteria bacterium]
MEVFERRLMQSVWNILDMYLLKCAENGFILCISGGKDSRCLMEIVAKWPNRFSKILIASVDHCTRESTTREAFFVASRAKRLGFDARILTLSGEKDLKEGVLRKKRYSILFDLAKEMHISTLVTAHTQNDQVENVLMTLVGVSEGSYGTGMSMESSSSIIGSFGQQGRLVRPLLNMSRKYLSLILSALNIEDYFKDPSNVYNGGQRVFIRKILEKYPERIDRLSRLAERRKIELSNIQEFSNIFIEKQTFNEMRLDLKKCPFSWRKLVLINAFQLFCPGREFRGTSNLFNIFFKNTILQRGNYILPFCRMEIQSDTQIILTRI